MEVELPGFEFQTGNHLLHSQCAFFCDVDHEELNADRCGMCGQQYFPEESVLQIRKGVLDDDTITTEGTGYAHWSCAIDRWDLPVLFNDGDS